MSRSLRRFALLRVLSFGGLLLVPLAGCDCGGSLPADAGEDDAGSHDPGRHDAGSNDAGSNDAGSDDAGSNDAGSNDAGSNDAGLNDAGSNDAGSDDAGSDDAGSDDAGSDDAGSDDAGSDDDGPVEEPCVPDGPEVCDGLDNDCNGTVDDDCVCPLLTYDCAVGCCALETEEVSPGNARYPDVTVDVLGNVLLAYAHSSGGQWRTGFSRHERAAGQWTHSESVPDGFRTNQVIVGPSGRIHQSYTGDSGRPAHYRYSDDDGATWSELAPITGTMKIGGACSLAIDSLERPHLWCGFIQPHPNQSWPTYLYWDGTAWVRQALNLDASSDDGTRLFIGYQDRPHLVHTYGPAGSNRELHYTFFTGSQWVQEIVPFPEGLRVHPDYRPGAVLAAGDVLHLAFVVDDPQANAYAVWYGVRTPAGAWTFEEAVEPARFSGNTWTDVDLALDEDGQPVLLTGLGSLAWRDANGDWNHVATGHTGGVLAVKDGLAYVVFPTDTGTRALHLDLFPLEDEAD